MTWLEERLAARTSPPADSFALGEAAFRTVLREREMVDLSADELLRVAWADLEANAAALVEEAGQLGPRESVEAVIERFEADHTSADGVVPFTQMVLERLRSFILEHDLVSIPSELRIQARADAGLPSGRHRHDRLTRRARAGCHRVVLLHHPAATGLERRAAGGLAALPEPRDRRERLGP